MCLVAYCACNQCRCELVYRKEGDNETIFQMEQSIARIVRLTVKHAYCLHVTMLILYQERISHQFCYPKHKRSRYIQIFMSILY